MSERHWTPIAACRVAAQWLAPNAGCRVLDVGSGVGKLCLVGSLTTEATFVGVEQRPHLVQIARDLASELGAETATFLCDDAFTIDWREFTSLYFFNPFAEAIFPEAVQIDSTVECTEQGYDLVLERLARKLADLQRGTRVVVYHSVGCPMPEGFRCLDRQLSGHSSLELWVRE